MNKRKILTIIGSILLVGIISVVLLYKNDTINNLLDNGKSNSNHQDNKNGKNAGKQDTNHDNKNNQGNSDPTSNNINNQNNNSSNESNKGNDTPNNYSKEGNPNKAKSPIEIDNGLLFFYKDDCSECVAFKDELLKYENANIKIFNLNDKKDYSVIKDYYDGRKKDIEQIGKISQLEDKFNTLKLPKDITDAFPEIHSIIDKYGMYNIKDAPKEVQIRYNTLVDKESKKKKEVIDEINKKEFEVVNIINKNENKITDEVKNKISPKLKEIADLQELNEDELLEYITLTLINPPSIKVVLNELPSEDYLIEYIENGTVSFKYSTKDKMITKDLLNNKSELSNFILKELQVSNLQKKGE